MFFSAQLSILVLGYFLASEWSREIYHALGNPAAHLFRAVIISLGVFSIVVGLPYLLLWRSYKKARSSFVSPEDEIAVTVGRPWQWRVLGVGLAEPFVWLPPSNESAFACRVRPPPAAASDRNGSAAVFL
jgi:hypothetical protein